MASTGPTQCGLCTPLLPPEPQPQPASQPANSRRRLHPQTQFPLDPSTQVRFASIRSGTAYGASNAGDSNADARCASCCIPVPLRSGAARHAPGVLGAEVCWGPSMCVPAAMFDAASPAPSPRAVSLCSAIPCKEPLQSNAPACYPLQHSMHRPCQSVVPIWSPPVPVCRSFAGQPVGLMASVIFRLPVTRESLAASRAVCIHGEKRARPACAP